MVVLMLEQKLRIGYNKSTLPPFFPRLLREDFEGNFSRQLLWYYVCPQGTQVRVKFVKIKVIFHTGSLPFLSRWYVFLMHRQNWKSEFISGHDPDKDGRTQSEVLALLASSKSANNFTAEQSAQISQLASDTQVPSPCFILGKSEGLPNPHFHTIIHSKLYRCCSNFFSRSGSYKAW